MRVSDFEIPTHLGAVLVVPTLPAVGIEPDAGLAKIDVFERFNMLSDFRLQSLGQPRPQLGIRNLAPRPPEKMRVANVGTAGPATGTIKHLQGAGH